MRPFWENVWQKSANNYRSINPTKDLPWEIFTHDPYLPLILNELKNRNGKLLDIGCGSGYDTKFFHDNNFEALGIDIAQNAINIAKNNFNDVKFECKDILYDAFDTNFNLIYDKGCIHNFTINGIFNETLGKFFFLKLYNLLQIGGEIILLTGNYNQLPDYSTTQASKIKVSDIETCCFPLFRIKMVREIDYIQNTNYGNSLGWLFILEKN